MNVAPNAVVALDVELWDFWGNLLRKTDEPLLYLHGGADGILPSLEAALAGKTPGEIVDVRLEPEEAFGEYDERLLRVEPRRLFTDALETGMQFEGIPGDEDDDAIYIVTDIAEDKVVLDANHPLAGIGLRFVCKVVEVRPANVDELGGVVADGASLLMRILP